VPCGQVAEVSVGQSCEGHRLSRARVMRGLSAPHTYNVTCCGLSVKGIRQEKRTKTGT
jgi:hypothetical protein